MAKKVATKRKAKVPTVSTSYGITQLYYEIDTFKIQMKSFSDADLFDYCMPHIEQYKHRELDNLYPKLAQGESLTKEERKKLEAFCILSNVELFLVD